MHQVTNTTEQNPSYDSENRSNGQEVPEDSLRPLITHKSATEPYFLWVKFSRSSCINEIHFNIIINQSLIIYRILTNFITSQDVKK